MNNSNYLKQKGLLPLAISAIGIFIHIFFILGTLILTIPIYINYFSGEPPIIVFLAYLYFIPGMIAIVWSIPLIAGSIFVSAFPEIKLTDQGIECRVYKIFRKNIMWSEVCEILDLPNNFKALVLHRRGFFLFNGLWENQLYGQYVKNNKKPVLFLSSKLENREEAINFIKSKINIGQISLNKIN